MRLMGPDPDIILGQWWEDPSGRLLIQPRPESGKSSLAANGALLTAKQLDGLAKGPDGFVDDVVAAALGLRKIPREQRTFREGQYQKNGSTVKETDQ